MNSENKLLRIKIKSDLIKKNTEIITERFEGEIVGVTKGVCGNVKIAEQMIEGGAEIIGDSRVDNLKKLSDSLDVDLMLLRTPMCSNISDVVRYADISLNSEFEVMKKLSKEAVKQDKVHRAIIMVDVGDRREGIMPQDFIPLLRKVKDLENLEVIGIGTNVGCYGGVQPTFENTEILVKLAEKANKELNFSLTTLSGGSTITLKLMEEDKLPQRINQLRIGEGILLGTSISQDRDIPYLHRNVFEIEAEIIEVKEKPSVPEGEIGQDAFGKKPEFKDRGIRRRAIAAIGKQDTDTSNLTPKDDGVEILGASSDHMILDVEDMERDIKIGDTLSFLPTYSGMLKAFTSEYVDKMYI
ncbi:MAG: alanine/ornithine racemase family PLP-dependent enzyme [Thermoplasmata archaeon]